MIVISEEVLQEYSNRLSSGYPVLIDVQVIDDGDVFTLRSSLKRPLGNHSVIKGLLTPFPISVTDENHYDVVVTVNIEGGTISSASGFVSTPHGFESRELLVVPLREEIYSRTKDFYETSIFSEKRVLIVGVGSGGSSIAIELAKAGVGTFHLVDNDRLEAANVVRHVCGISDLGRYKTKAVRDFILEKNPYANVLTYEQKCDWTNVSWIQTLINQVDLVFCCTDNRESRMLINSVAVTETKPCIYGGTFRRAYGGQVIRVVPHQSLCYQCYLATLPQMAEDQEISSELQAQSIAYSDRLIPIEPGLSTDIAPISNFCVKLGILELLRGSETTLKSLYEDLDSPVYYWVNRRELGTGYAGLAPLDEGEDFRILAWYGLDEEKAPDCPVCGDFVSLRAQQSGIQIDQDDVDAFLPLDDEAPVSAQSFPRLTDS